MRGPLGGLDSSVVVIERGFGQVVGVLDKVLLVQGPDLLFKVPTLVRSAAEIVGSPVLERIRLPTHPGGSVGAHPGRPPGRHPVRNPLPLVAVLPSGSGLAASSLVEVVGVKGRTCSIAEGDAKGALDTHRLDQHNHAARRREPPTPMNPTNHPRPRPADPADPAYVWTRLAGQLKPVASGYLSGVHLRLIRSGFLDPAEEA
jgi:hypothetical protein